MLKKFPCILYTHQYTYTGVSLFIEINECFISQMKKLNTFFMHALLETHTSLSVRRDDFIKENVKYGITPFPLRIIQVIYHFNQLKKKNG